MCTPLRNRFRGNNESPIGIRRTLSILTRIPSVEIMTTQHKAVRFQLTVRILHNFLRISGSTIQGSSIAIKGYDHMSDQSVNQVHFAQMIGYIFILHVCRHIVPVYHTAMNGNARLFTSHIKATTCHHCHITGNFRIGILFRHTLPLCTHGYGCLILCVTHIHTDTSTVVIGCIAGDDTL